MNYSTTIKFNESYLEDELYAVDVHIYFIILQAFVWDTSSYHLVTLFLTAGRQRALFFSTSQSTLWRWVLPSHQASILDFTGGGSALIVVAFCHSSSWLTLIIIPLTLDLDFGQSFLPSSFLNINSGSFSQLTPNECRCAVIVIVSVWFHRYQLMSSQSVSLPRRVLVVCLFLHRSFHFPHCREHQQHNTACVVAFESTLTCLTVMFWLGWFVEALYFSTS